jgi:hypothetical protein
MTKKELNYIKSHDLLLIRNRVKSVKKLKNFKGEEEEDASEKEETKSILFFSC